MPGDDKGVVMGSRRNEGEEDCYQREKGKKMDGWGKEEKEKGKGKGQVEDEGDAGRMKGRRVY